MKSHIITLFLFFILSSPVFAQFNLGIGLGTGGPRSYFLELEPKIETSERVELGLSIIRGKISNGLNSLENNRILSIFHFNGNYKITASGFFLGLGAGITNSKGEIISSSGKYEFQNTEFSFMPKIGFKRKFEVSFSGLNTYHKKNKSISSYYMLNILYIFDLKKN